MPLSPKSKIVAIRTELTQRLMDKHTTSLKRKPTQTNQDFGGFVNDLLQEVIEKDNFLKVYAPSFQVLDIHDNVLMLLDNHHRNKVVEVYLKDGELWCSEDKNSTCKHVRFCFAVPEVARLNLTKPK